MSTVEPVLVLSSVLGIILELQVVCPLSVRLVNLCVTSPAPAECMAGTWASQCWLTGNNNYVSHNCQSCSYVDRQLRPADRGFIARINICCSAAAVINRPGEGFDYLKLESCLTCN